MLGEPRDVTLVRTFTDSMGRIITLVSSEDTGTSPTENSAHAIRLLPNGRFDPDFRSGLQPGLVTITKRNPVNRPFGGMLMGDRLVFLDRWQDGPRFVQTVSRMRGEAAIFRDGFEAP
jgi:hypothetical protein